MGLLKNPTVDSDGSAPHPPAISPARRAWPARPPANPPHPESPPSPRSGRRRRRAGGSGGGGGGGIAEEKRGCAASEGGGSAQRKVSVTAAAPWRLPPPDNGGTWLFRIHGRAAAASRAEVLLFWVDFEPAVFMSALVGFCTKQQ